LFVDISEAVDVYCQWTDAARKANGMQEDSDEDEMAGELAFMRQVSAPSGGSGASLRAAHSESESEGSEGEDED
jgi:transcription elongation factor Elf1